MNQNRQPNIEDEEFETRNRSHQRHHPKSHTPTHLGSGSLILKTENLYFD